MKPLASEPFDDWVAHAGVLGLWDVLKHYGYFRKKFHGMLARIAGIQPDAVLISVWPRPCVPADMAGKFFITSAPKSGPGTADASRKWPASSIS